MENTGIGFNLLGIKTEQFALIEDNFNESEEVNLVTNLEFKLGCEKKQMGVFANFKFEQKANVFLIIEVSCHFSINPDSWQAYCTDTEIVFPKGFMAHLSMLTVGTARGVLHSKTEGSSFNKFQLPLINVTELVVEDVVFNLNE